jgi:excinuclease ABC subunit C
MLGLPAPPQRIEGFDISNISGTFAVASLVSFRNGRPDRANYRRFKIKSVTGQDDFACIAEVVRRRYTRVLNETSGAPKIVPTAETNARKAEGEGHEVEPDGGMAAPEELQQMIDEVSTAARRRGRDLLSTDACAADVRARRAPGELRKRGVASLPNLILIDGGKGQLGAARAELEKLGLAQIPTIGLAKEFEEIYRPGHPEPLRLSHESGALKLLQRVRDESHRFANTYNAKLRLRRISESVLDEFPHIGERRKAALLKKFGSVQRLRLASVEKIAEVPGFGGKAAAELKSFLVARSVNE